MGETVNILLKRSGTVEEITNTVAFLTAKEAGYIACQNIKVNDGLSKTV